MRLIKSYKTSHGAFLLFTIALLVMCAVSVIISEAQSCPAGNVCSGDPCCGVSGCTPTEIACLAAGWAWSGACSQPAGSSSACDDIGKFWNFTGSTCQSDPPTQIVCEGVEALELHHWRLCQQSSNWNVWWGSRLDSLCLEWLLVRLGVVRGKLLR